MGDLPCPPYSNKRLEARIISKEKLPKICLVASATKHFSAKTLKCITKVKQSVQTSGATGDVVIFLATTAVLEVIRRLSKARCPFIWHGLQALQVLCYSPFKWIQKWVPLKPLVRQLQKLSRPMLLLSIATVFSDQSSSTGEATSNDYHDSQARSRDEVQDDGYPERWLLELHRELREKGISVPERLNDDELRQFYAATNGDFARLLSSVEKTIKWRQSYTFFSPEELETWSPFIFWHGHDANQRPCLIIRVGLACSNLRSNGRSLLIKAVVSQIERGILRLVNVEHPQITVLMDCEGLSPLGFPIHMMRSCAMLLQDHYPNRLSSLIIVRLPQVAQLIMQTFFQLTQDNPCQPERLLNRKKSVAVVGVVGLEEDSGPKSTSCLISTSDGKIVVNWFRLNLLTGVLKPATRQKVRIIGRNHLEFLSNYLDSIPPFLGGNCSCSKCSNQGIAEGKSDEATRTERTPDHANRSETPDHLNQPDEVSRTEPDPDQVEDSPEFNHHNVSNTSRYKEELIKTIIIGILMVWIFIAVIVAMDYPERWPLLRST